MGFLLTFLDAFNFGIFVDQSEVKRHHPLGRVGRRGRSRGYGTSEEDQG